MGWTFTVCGWSTLPVNNWWVSTGRSFRSSRPFSRSWAVAFPGGLRHFHITNIFSFCMATDLCSALMSSKALVVICRWMAICSHSFPSVLATFMSSLSVRVCPMERFSVMLSGKKRQRQSTYRQIKSSQKIKHSWNILLKLLSWDQSSDSKDDTRSPDTSTVQGFLLATSSDLLPFLFRPPFPEDVHYINCQIIYA